MSASSVHSLCRGRSTVRANTLITVNQAPQQPWNEREPFICLLIARNPTGRSGVGATTHEPSSSAGHLRLLCGPGGSDSILRCLRVVGDGDTQGLYVCAHKPTRTDIHDVDTFIMYRLLLQPTTEMSGSRCQYSVRESCLHMVGGVAQTKKCYATAHRLPSTVDHLYKIYLLQVPVTLYEVECDLQCSGLQTQASLGATHSPPFRLAAKWRSGTYLHHVLPDACQQRLRANHPGSRLADLKRSTP